MTFDDFVAPLGADRFMADHYGRRPAHLPADGRGARAVFGWDRMNAVLGIASHWTPGALKMVINSQRVAPEHYTDEVLSVDGLVRRADPAKVNLFLGMGASLVANAAEEVAPEIRAVTAMLGERFTALASANIYCSFDGVQAFATHYDTHEVFALQCEGEKTWRLYANRAADPVDHPPSGPDAQAAIDAARGPIAMQVTTRPGDLLYIPRGVYHDALAQSGASMHVTFAVAPRTGMVIRPLLEALMKDDAAFRAYLPAPEEEAGAALAERLAELGDRMAEMMRTPAFALAVANEQRKVAVGRAAMALPDCPVSTYYARTPRHGEVRGAATGALLVANGRQTTIGAAIEAAQWAVARPAFSLAELDARFGYVPVAARRALVDLLVREGLVQRYTPTL
jgi:lysine-specific demethylase/histidyl-hydroxylase NO66